MTVLEYFSLSFFQQLKIATSSQGEVGKVSSDLGREAVTFAQVSISDATLITYYCLCVLDTAVISS